MTRSEIVAFLESKAEWIPGPLATPCLEWRGSLHRKGYAIFTRKKHHYRVTRLLHRLKHGPMSANLMPDHLCRNRACINVAHTELVTNRINVLRGDSWSARNARKMACPRGHPYDEANTSIIHRADGTTFRRCRICKREQNARQSILRDLRGRLGVEQ